MKDVRIILWAALILLIPGLILILFRAPVGERLRAGGDASLIRPDTPASEIADAPYVRSVIPQTKGQSTLILSDQVVTIRFDRPMRSAEPDGPVALTIDPPVDGTTHWPASDTLQFTPLHGWPWGTDFTIEVPAGLMAEDGGTTQAGVRFTLSTPEPRILSVEPPAGQRVKAGEPLILHFNQPMDLNEVRPGTNVQLYPTNDEDSRFRVRRDGFYNVEVTYGTDKDGQPDRSVLVLTPTFPYQYHTDYQLVVKAGLFGSGAAFVGSSIETGTNNYGLKGLAEDFTWDFYTERGW